jgi:hypothetical protein
MRMPRLIALEDLMPRFYFDLASKDEHITDQGGKDLDTLNDAYDCARKLIDKILFHVGYDDADTWKVIISNDEHDAQMIVPFAVSDILRAERRRIR